jgi:hypothetical protein
MLSNGYLTPNNYNYPNPYASYGDLNYPLRTVWTQTFGATILPARTRFLFSYQSNTGMNSPYGVPLLRSAYDYYLINTELNRIMVNAANFKASPIPVLIINPNQMSTDNGDTALDSVGNALSTLGDSGKANPFLLLQGTKDSISIEQLNTTANLTDLTYMRKYIDSMILTSLGFPSDLAGLSDKGSYGLGKAQQDLLSRTVNAMAKQLKEALIRQFVRPMLEDNFGEREDFGSFSQVDTEQQHIDTNLKIITTLREQGIKLKSDSIMSLVNIDKDAIESENNPIVDIDDSRDPFGAFRGLGD